MTARLFKKACGFRIKQYMQLSVTDILVLSSETHREFEKMRLLTEV
jgi:hypothetical protein